jgi:hypothetical protein
MLLKWLLDSNQIYFLFIKTMDLKRLWDTENKKIVRAVNKDTNKAYQVWTNDDGSKLYIYKKNGWVELDQTKEDVKEY